MLNDYTVDILGKLPPYLREFNEFKNIATAQTPEIEAFIRVCNEVLDNLFIGTANEYGISRYESLLDIVPASTDTIELRRAKVLLKVNEKLPYTDKTLDELLTSFCGAGNYSIVKDYDNYKISVETNLADGEVFDEVCFKLREVIPANLQAEYNNYLAVATELARVNVDIYCTFTDIITV